MTTITIRHNGAVIELNQAESDYLLDCFDDVGDLFCNEQEQAVYRQIRDKLNSLPDVE